MGTILYVEDPTCLLFRPLVQVELPKEGLTDACLSLLRYQLHNGTEEDRKLIQMAAQQLMDYFDVQES